VKIFGEICGVPFQGLLRVLNVDQLQNLLHKWTGNHEMNLLSMINLSLEIGYCNMTLRHCLIVT
jgi:hypothetical protein